VTRRTVEPICIFFDEDDTARWRALLWSWISGTLVGVVLAVTDATTESLAYVSLTVSVLTFCGFIVSYVRTFQSVTMRPVLKPRRAFFEYVWSALTVVLVATIERIFISPEALHAAALETIQSVRENKPVSLGNLSVLSLRAKHILEVGNLKGARRQQAVQDYATIQASLAYVKAERSNRINTDVKRSESELNFRLPSGSFAIGGFPCNSGFYNLSLVTSVAGVRLIPDRHNCALIFRDVRIKGFTQTIDCFVCIDVIFEDCDLSYSGGPLILCGVTFTNCRINERLSELVRSLTPGSSTVTLTSDFSQ
jgi:hypothetical protein